MLIITALLATTCLATAAEQIGKSNFASNFPTIEPKKDYYYQGDGLTVTYTIQPKTEDDRKKLDNRHYIISTELDQPSWKINIIYYNGGIESLSLKNEKEVDVNVKDWEEGLDQIQINLTGKVPSIDGWYQEVTLLEFKISDADEDSLEPVVIEVVNPSKFEEELTTVENSYKELYQKAENATFDVSEVLDLLEKVEKDIGYARDYYSKDKFSEAIDSLNSAKENIESAQLTLLKSELNYRFENLDKEKREISNVVTVLEYQIDDLDKKGVNVVYLKANLSEIKNDLETLDGFISKISVYLESSNYELAEKNIETAEEMIKEVKTKVDTLKLEIDKLQSEQKGFFDTLIQYLENSKSYLTYVGVVFVVVVVVLAALKLRGGRGKWDELR